MKRTASRITAPYILAAVTSLLASAAIAQTDAGGVDSDGAGGTATAAPLTATDFSFHLERWDTAQTAWVAMTATEQSYYFNRARCECDGDTANDTGYFRVAIEPAPGTAGKIQSLLAQNLGGSGAASLYAGSDVVNCLTPARASLANYADYCVNLLDPGNPLATIAGGMATIAASRVWVSDPIPVAWLFGAVAAPACKGSGCDAKAACATVAATATIYFWAQTSADPTPDMQNSAFTVNLVGQAPPAPANVAAAAGNEALTVTWSWPIGLAPPNNPSILGVQLFCTRGQDYQVFPSGTFSPAFITSSMMCPGDAPVASSQLAFGNLSPLYLCSSLVPTSTTSHRIPGLQNGIPYGVGVATVDRYLNLSPIAMSDVVFATPEAGTGGDGGARVATGCGCGLGGQPAGCGAILGLLALGLVRRLRSRR